MTSTSIILHSTQKGGRQLSQARQNECPAWDIGNMAADMGVPGKLIFKPPKSQTSERSLALPSLLAVMKNAPIHQRMAAFSCLHLMERAGFEPAEPLRVQLFSSWSPAVRGGFSCPSCACASAVSSVLSV
jgi:hypothetical protein